MQNSLYAYFFSVLLLQFKQAFGTEAAIVEFGNVLYFVNAELHYAALAFGIRVCLAFNSSSTSFAGNDFMFAMS